MTRLTCNPAIWLLPMQVLVALTYSSLALAASMNKAGANWSFGAGTSERQLCVHRGRLGSSAISTCRKSPEERNIVPKENSKVIGGVQNAWISDASLSCAGNSFLNWPWSEHKSGPDSFLSPRSHRDCLSNPAQFAPQILTPYAILFFFLLFLGLE